MTTKRGPTDTSSAKPERSVARNGHAPRQPVPDKLDADVRAETPVTPAPPTIESARSTLPPGPAELFAQLQQIWSGQSDIAPEPRDRRFQDPVWASNPFYRGWLQSYLAWGKWLDATVNAMNLERHSAAQTNFLLEQIRDAVAPTNFFWGNPAAVRRAFETGGASLMRGAANWMDDAAHHGGMPQQVNHAPFKVGENMAATPGAVVYRSEMFELLQYTPQTERVYARPSLVVPPQVNRYYAVDLAPGRSLVEYLVKAGIQQFLIVWRNPTADQRDWGMASYSRAILEAVDVVRQISGSPDVNASGACAGGMTLAAVLGNLAARGESPISAATFLVTMLDTSVDSQLGLLADETMLGMALQASQQAGILTGEQLGQVFSWLRPNDLVWNYWVNNYLLGEEPPAFDVLAWNDDSTNLTAQLHHDLIDLIRSNGLARHGALQVLGTPVDLSQVSCDTFLVAAQTDHIVPWQGCYASSRLFGGKAHFVLSASGHIQSIVAPPGSPKARFYTNPRSPADPAAWLAGASEHAGSWWESYAEWLVKHSGKHCLAPAELGSATYPVLGPAPGTYVFS